MSDLVCCSRREVFSAILALVVGHGGAVYAAPPEYTVVDITGWSAAQLSTLPFFKHAMPTPPTGSGVPYNFSPIARATSGLVAGNGPEVTPYSGSTAYRLSPAGAGWMSQTIPSYGVFNWGYWSCDAVDCHYHWGYVRDSDAMDINHAGVVVGLASMPGNGSTTLDVVYHAFVDDPVSGRVDPFPSVAGSTQAICINNSGEIGGYMYGSGTPLVGGFRLRPDGSLVELNRINGNTCVPRWINSRGQMIGSHYPSRAFISPSGSATISLPPLGGHPRVVASDLNDQGWVVGFSGPFNEPEVFATIWEPRPDGTWRAWDLTEQLLDRSMILEQAVAINNRGEILARGHLDGTDLFSSRTYLLTPVEPLAGWCLPDIGRQPSDVVACAGGNITFTVEVVNTGDVTGYQWRRDGSPIPPAMNPSAAASTLLLTGVQPGESGVFDCVITSACGEVTSNMAMLISCCAADVNGSGDLTPQDMFDFLAMYFAGDARGDFDGSGTWTVQDIFDFLAAYFAGCV
ncbi:MAG: GC-type dockerin domain-anchored protein [Phycisphaerales bacterium]